MEPTSIIVSFFLRGKQSLEINGASVCEDITSEHSRYSNYRSAWWARALHGRAGLLSSVYVRKIFHIFTANTPIIFMVALSPLLLSTRSSNQKQHAIQMCSLQPRSQSTWGMLRREKQLLEGQGKPQQQLGDQQNPRGRRNREKKVLNYTINYTSS